MKLLGLALSGIALCAALPVAALATEAAIDKQVADIFAGTAVSTAQTVGISVGIVHGTKPFRFYSYGYADAVQQVPFTADSEFEIASNTKVFTTALLGKKIAAGTYALDTPLSNFRSEIGKLQPLTRKITLGQLGSFTAGLPQYAQICTKSAVPGCLPSQRPDINTYTADDFVLFFENTLPQNYNNDPATPVTSLPVPYFYSDYSTGLLGLLVASTPGVPVTNATLNAWYKHVDNQIVKPLGMTSTYLDVPPSVTDQALGYSLPATNIAVTSGQVSAISVGDPGGAYSSAPAVTITGGAGTGATATATIDGKGGISGINVTNPGSGYIAPATVALNNGGSTSTGHGQVLVSGGQVVGVIVTDPGAGYTKTPTVTISGGRTADGSDATAVAHVLNGQVRYFTIKSAGAGYVDPLTVSVAPGDPESNTIPIWAPAGALSSTVRDLTKFAAAAMGEPSVAGKSVPPLLSQGFAIARQACACDGAKPALSKCGTGQRTGLAWDIRPQDTAVGFPLIVFKNGSLQGYSSQIVMIPKLDIAVVVMANSDTGAPAAQIAFSIAYQLSHLLGS